MIAKLSVALLALVTLVAAAPAEAQKLRQPSASSALKQLVRQTNALPSTTATKKQKAKLKSYAAVARRSARGRPCMSVSQLNRFRRTLRGVKVKKGRRNRRGANRLGALGPLSMSASRALLTSSRTKRCGGGVKPTKLQEPRTTILQNDANGMKLRVDMPALQFAEAEGGGRTWTQLALAQSDTPADPGSPGIPVVARTLGVPEGAALKVDATDTTSYTVDGVDVFPVQPQPVDQGGPGQPPDFTKPPYATRPFLLDSREYRKRGNVPAEPADGDVLGRSRDVTLANLQLPAAQYNAAAKRLEVITSVEVDVTFEGGSHRFAPQLLSPWEQPQRSLVSALLNREVVGGGQPAPTGERCGEEMLVITHSSTSLAASHFANAKRRQGMRTTVVEAGAASGADSIGTTPAEIQTYIRSRLTAPGCIHPSYVTILGDDELVPTFPGILGVESDLEYSLRDSDDELPDVAVGRIVGDDLTQVATAVNKIVEYESGPPDGVWQRRATLAAAFQDDDGDGDEDRTFTLFSEVVRNGILAEPGFPLLVDRLYRESTPGGTPTTMAYGHDLPAELEKPGFAWDADHADVTAAWNEGRYLIVHRDHGSPRSWGDPDYFSTHVDALTNGDMLPVVLSINCSSGAFQDADDAFATRALVNPNGGAVGVFGDTEVSPTGHNTQIGWGFADALMTRVLPDEGPPGRLRMGDALIHGKNKLAAQSSPTTDGNTRKELYLWHYFGDPSMQMWGGVPIDFPVISDFHADFDPGAIGPPQPDPPPYGVRVTLPPAYDGQAFALLRNGQVVGKGVAAGGKAVVPASLDTSQPKPGELFVAFEGEGAVAIQIPVEGVPEPPQEQPPQDPGPKTDTQLTITCPQHTSINNGTAHITGKLTPAFAGAAVQLTYQPRTDANPPGPAVNRVATTDAQGNWKDDFDTGANDPNGKGDGGFWTVTAKYAGDSTRNAASPVSCQFLEPNN